MSKCGVSIFRVIADYESYFDDELRQGVIGEADERIIEERAGITLGQRFLALEGQKVALILRNAEKVTGRIIDVATSWVLIEGQSEEVLIPMAAIAQAALPQGVLPEGVRLSARLGVGSILRRLSQRSISVRIVHDGGMVRGTVDAVYADHVDIVPEREICADVRDISTLRIVTIPLERVNKISVTSSGW